MRTESAPSDLGAHHRRDLPLTTLLSMPAVLAGGVSCLVAISRAIGRDSGVFLYSGQTILRGGAPYLDAWDHKGPLLYLFNAAGAGLTGGDILGVAVLEGVLLTVGVLAFTLIVARTWGALTGALVGTAVALSYFQVFEGGNFSETWSFPFALVAYAVVAAGLGSRSPVVPPWVAGISLGLAGAVVGLIRPSNGLGLLGAAIWFVVAWPHTDSTRLGRATWILGAGALVAVPVILYVSSVGAWSAMWDQYITYNLNYSASAGSLDRAVSIVSILRLSMSAPVTLVALIAGGTLLATGRRGEAAPMMKRRMVALAAVASATTLDFVGANLSGRGFPHYAVTVLPGLGSVAALVVGSAIAAGALGAVAQSTIRSVASVAICVMLALGLGILRPALGAVESMLRTGLTNTQSTISVVAAEIQRRAAPSEPIYVWGAETSFLAASRRESSSAITYLYPATRPIGDVLGAGLRLATDLRERPPALIVRAPGWECPFTEPCDVSALTQAHEFISQNYRLDELVAGDVEFWVPR